MKTIHISKYTGAFAEDKDAAAEIRRDIVLPTLEAGESLVVNFDGVRVATQSFIHALISQALRQHGDSALRHIEFEGCVPFVRGIIETVVQYTLESNDSDPE